MPKIEIPLKYKELERVSEALHRLMVPSEGVALDHLTTNDLC